MVFIIDIIYEMRTAFFNARRCKTAADVRHRRHGNPPVLRVQLLGVGGKGNKQEIKGREQKAKAKDFYNRWPDCIWLVFSISLRDGSFYFKISPFFSRISATMAQAGQSQYRAPASFISLACAAMPAAASAPK